MDTQTNREFGLELEKMMDEYPESKVFCALNMAVKNLKNGNPARYNIQSDWDKYGSRYDFSVKLNELCFKYGFIDENGHWIPV